MLGAPSGAFFSSKGFQSGVESRTSSSILPSNPSLMPVPYPGGPSPPDADPSEPFGPQPAANVDAAATPAPAAKPPNIFRRDSRWSG